jgi:hypothetical protein
LEAERQAYLSTIERTFVSLRGRGFMLSAKEVALVDGWYASGVPARVVIRALHEGFDRRAARRQSAPSSLAYFEGHVERAIEDWQRRHPGAAFRNLGPESDLSGRLVAALDRLIADASSPEIATALGGVRTSLDAPDGGEDDSTLTTRLDGMIVGALAETLSPEERGNVNERARQTALAAGSMSDRARAGIEAAEFARAVRVHCQVVGLMEVLD